MAARAKEAKVAITLKRREAAAALGVSLRHFERYIQPHLPCVYSGSLRLYRVADLQRWADDQVAREGAGG